MTQGDKAGIEPHKHVLSGGARIWRLRVTAPIYFAVSLRYSKHWPGPDEICPEKLKALDIVGLCWLTHLFNVLWKLDSSHGMAMGTQRLRSIFHVSKKAVWVWAIVIPSCVWNSGPGHYPYRDTGIVIGECQSTLHVFCVLGEGFRLCL